VATPSGAGVVRHRGITLVAMCLGAMMTFLTITSSATALSAIQDDLRVSPTDLIWIPSSYTLLVASLVLSAGTLGNLYGRRRLFVLGVLVMMVGSSIVVLAPTTVAVIAGQVVTGIGGALILPNSLAVLGAAFTDPHRRTEVVTAWAASSGIGLAIGPFIAGELLARYTWHEVFLSTVALGVVVLLITASWVPESRQAGERLDLAGLVLGTLSIGALVYALIRGGPEGYGSPRILVVWGTAAVAVIVFVIVELRRARPMLDLRLFRSASYGAVNIVAAVSLFGFNGLAILSVLFYERVQNLTALEVAWRLLVMFGVYVVVAFVTGRVTRWTGFKGPLTIGLVLGGLACLGLMVLQPTTDFEQVWPLFAAFGVASGLVAAPSAAAAVISVGPERAGMASGTVNTARQVGSVMGASLLGTLLTTRLAAELPGQLAAHGVPATDQPAIEAAVAGGTSTTDALSGSARAAIADAFTAGVHAGTTVIGLVFLSTAVLALAFVRNRPYPRHRARRPLDYEPPVPVAGSAAAD
jgi:EmrB/QacA subfamily drug resistance transporter